MLVAVVVLLGLGVSATGMSQLTQIRLTEAVNRNWRGAYDVLVTPRIDTATSGAALTSGLIEPDFLAYGGHGGISFSQLDAIRKMAGVAVAAPVTTVGYIASDAAAPHVYVSRSRLPRRPTLYRVSLRVATSDGVHQFTMERQTAEFVLGPATPRMLKGLSPSPFLDSDGSWSGDPGGVDLGLLPLAPPVTPVVAVDPRAEQQLFGRSFAFLKALSIVPAELRLATFPQSLIPPGFPVSAGDLGSLQDAAKRGGSIAESAGGVYPQEPVVPIVVSNHLSYPLRLTLTVDRVGHPLGRYPGNPRLTPAYALLRTAERQAGPGMTRLGTVSENMSGELRAYEPPSLTLTWPGGSSEQGNAYLAGPESNLATQLARRATYKQRAGPGSVPAYRIRPLGLVDWGGQAGASQAHEPALVGLNAQGTTQSYRDFISAPFAVAPAFHRPKGVPGDPVQAFFLAPVGSFDFARLHLPSNPLNHVPLGAWEPATARLLPRRRSGQARTLTPTSNPLGFLTSPPEVIANIDQASLLRGPDPIDAIRVRVGGLSGFDAAARAKVERVASQIAQLGLDARIVAGSSPRAVDVYVPRYLAGGRDLGWVQEEWTSLGAAQAASSALSGAEKALLFLSLALALLLAVTVSSVGLEGGARDVRVWHSLGWSRGRMLWWLVSDATLGGLLVACAAVAAILVGGRVNLVVLGLALGGSLLAIQLLFALLLLRRELGGSTRTVRRRRLVRRGGSTRTGVVALAARGVIRQARISILIAVGVTLSAIVVVLGVGALRSVSRSTHTSLLGTYLDTSLLAFHAVSLVLLVVGGIAASAIATRAWQRRRTGEISAFAALGWRRDRVLAQLRLERVLLALASALLALCLAALLHATGIALGGELAVPIILALCAGYILAGELPSRSLVQSRWPS